MVGIVEEPSMLISRLNILTFAEKKKRHLKFGKSKKFQVYIINTDFFKIIRNYGTSLKSLTNIV
jgi:hypothetical protein